MVEDLLFTFLCRGSSSGYFYTLIAVYMSHAADLLNITVLVDVRTSPWLFNTQELMPRTGHFSGCCYRNTVLLLLYKNAERFYMWSRKALNDGNKNCQMLGRPFISLLKASDRQLRVTVLIDIYQRGPHYTIEFPIDTACVVDSSHDNSIFRVLLLNSMRFFRWSRMALTEGRKHKPCLLTKEHGGVGYRLQDVVPINVSQESLPAATLVFSLPENVLPGPQCYSAQLKVCSGMGEDVATRGRHKSCDRDVLVIRSLTCTDHELNATIPSDIGNYGLHGRVDQLLNTSNIAAFCYDNDFFLVLYRNTRRFDMWSRMALADGKCNSSKTYHLSVRDPIDIHQHCSSGRLEFRLKSEQICDSSCNSDILRVIYRNTKRFDMWSRRALTDGKNNDTNPWHLAATVLTDDWQEAVPVVSSITDNVPPVLQCSTPVGFGGAQGVRTRDEPKSSDILYTSLLNGTDHESRVTLPTDIHRYWRDDGFEALATNASISFDENDLLCVLLYNARRFEIWSRKALTDGSNIVSINDRHESQAFPRAILINVLTEEILPVLQSQPGQISVWSVEPTSRSIQSTNLLNRADQELKATLPANIHHHWTENALPFLPNTTSTIESLYDRDLLHVLQCNTKRFDMWSRMALTDGKNNEPRLCYLTTEHLLSDKFVYVLTYRVLPVLKSNNVQSRTAVGVERIETPTPCGIQHISSLNHTNNELETSFATNINHDGTDNGLNTMFATQSHCDMDLLHLLQCNTKRFDLWSRMALTDGKNNEPRPRDLTTEYHRVGYGFHNSHVVSDLQESQALSDEFVYVLKYPVLQSHTEQENVQSRTPVVVDRKDKPKACGIQHICSLNHTDHEFKASSAMNIHHDSTDKGPNTMFATQSYCDMELLDVLQYNIKRFDMWSRMALTDGKNNEPRPWRLTNEHGGVDDGLQVSVVIEHRQESKTEPNDTLDTDNIQPVLKYSTEEVSMWSDISRGGGGTGTGEEPTPCNTTQISMLHCVGHEPKVTLPTEGNLHWTDDKFETLKDERRSAESLYDDDLLRVLHRNTKRFDMWSKMALTDGNRNFRTCNCSFINCLADRLMKVTVLIDVHQYWPDDGLPSTTTCFPSSCCDNNVLRVLYRNTKRFHMWSRMALCSGTLQNALQPSGVDSVETEKDKTSSGWLSHIPLSTFTPNKRVMAVLGVGLVAVGVVALLKRRSG